MESKLPPPPGRVFGGPPPVAGRAQPQPRAFARREAPPPPPGRLGAPPTAFNSGGNGVRSGEASASASATDGPSPAPAFGLTRAGPPKVQTQAQTTSSPFSSPAVSRPKDLWRPGRRGGRHDSPLYGQHRKRPSMDSNVSWSGSDAEAVHATTAAATSSAPSHNKQHSHTAESGSSAAPWAAPAFPSEEEEGAGWGDIADASTLFASPSDTPTPPPPPATAVSAAAPPQTKPEQPEEHVEPPKTPKGDSTHSPFEEPGGLTASQRVRMGISTRAGSRANSGEGLGLSARAGSRANSTEDFSEQAGFDEEKNGPRSCPPDFSDKQPHFSLDKVRAMRSNELVASKLLPTRSSVNSLMGYVRELQQSEASLRKQLVKTKKHTETELSQSLTKVSELERSMQEVERDRELARRKLAEQEQLIRDLAAKLKQAEAKKSPVKSGVGAVGVDELPPIEEEAASHVETSVSAAVSADAEQRQEPTEKVEAVQEPPQQAEAPVPSAPTRPPVRPAIARLNQEQIQEAERPTQYAIASPRSPNKPLWDPWASGGVTPMKNLPPMFTIGAPEMDLMASSSGTQETSEDNPAPAAGGEHELKSVLPSPRRTQAPVQEQEQAQSQAAETQGAPQWGREEEYDASSSPTAQQQVPGMFSPQYSAPMFNVGAMPPSPPYQQQPASFPAQDASYAAPARGDMQQEAAPSPLQAPSPMFAVGGAAPVKDGSLYQQDMSPAPVQETEPFQQEIASSDANQWSGFQAQTETQAPPSPVLEPPQFVDKSQESEDATGFPTNEQERTALPPPVMSQENAQEPVVAGESVQFTPEAGLPAPVAEESVAALADGPPTGPPAGGPPPSPGPSPPKAFTTKTGGNTPPKEATKAVGEPTVSLETLLVDFFTEVDNKRLKMAKVYGKRYAGREKWLFAELTKRYGAAKVAGLKERFESGSSSSKHTAVKSPAASKPTTPQRQELPKPHRQGHPRHPQFFNPASAAGMESSAPMPPVLPPALGEDTEGTTQQNQETVDDAPSPVRQEERAIPSRSAGDMPAFNGPPQPFQPPQTNGEGADDTESAPSAVNGPPSRSAQPPMGAPPRMNGPPMMQRGDANGLGGQQLPPAGPRGAGGAPMGLRQRNVNAGQDQQLKQPSAADAQTPIVTLEGLLKDLYRKHQPDKLKNVSLVAKQYAGKERELVGLLKGKYGALSVKQLEENLEVLERASRTQKGGTGKKRGCFLSSISVMFWLTVLAIVAVGSVLLSFAVLNAQECRAIDDTEDVTDDETTQCAPLKKELDNFTYERVGDYVRQPHSASCFCAEWSEREDALLANFSPEDLVDLARLLPFSPDAFGAPWIEAVKEQVPSQEFYEGYAKPVVDLSLDACSFIWSSLLEVTESVVEMITDEKPSTTASVTVDSDELMASMEEPEDEIPAPNVEFEDTERIVEEEENKSVEFETIEEVEVESNAVVEEAAEPDVSVVDTIEMATPTESENSVEEENTEDEVESAHADMTIEDNAVEAEANASVDETVEVEAVAVADEPEVDVGVDEAEEVATTAEEVQEVETHAVEMEEADLIATETEIKTDAEEMETDMTPEEVEAVVDEPVEDKAAVDDPEEVELTVEVVMEAETVGDDDEVSADEVAETDSVAEEAVEVGISASAKEEGVDDPAAANDGDDAAVEPEVAPESDGDATETSIEDTPSGDHGEEVEVPLSYESGEEVKNDVVEVEVHQEGLDLSYPEASSGQDDSTMDVPDVASQDSTDAPGVEHEQASVTEDAVEDAPASTNKVEVGGLASSVNEVLARLVEPFASRKVVPAEEEAVVEESSTEGASPGTSTDEEVESAADNDAQEELEGERELEAVAVENEGLSDEVAAGIEDVELAGEDIVAEGADVDTATADEPETMPIPENETDDDEAASDSYKSESESAEALDESVKADEDLHFFADEPKQVDEDVNAGSAGASVTEVEEEELDQELSMTVEDEEGVEPVLEDAPEVDSADITADDSITFEADGETSGEHEGSDILTTDDDTEATPDSDEGMPAFDEEAVHDDGDNDSTSGDINDVSAPTMATTEGELEAEFLAASNEEVVSEVQEEVVADEQESEQEQEAAVDLEAEVASQEESSADIGDDTEASASEVLSEDDEDDHKVSMEEPAAADVEEQVEESDESEEPVETDTTAETKVPVEAESDESVGVDVGAVTYTEAEPEIDAPVEAESEQAAEAEVEEEAEVAVAADIETDDGMEGDGDEEALFMDDLEDPDEVLRMAEQAAAAEL